MKVLPHLPDFALERVLATCPPIENLLRMIRGRQINLLFLCVDDFGAAKTLADGMEAAMPGFPIITLSSSENTEVLHNVMHLGIRDHLTLPIREPALSLAVESARERFRIQPISSHNRADLYTFLPAKPGVGTSTIAVSVSCVLAEDFGVRSLLLDADLYAGTVQFLLNLGPSSSLTDALAQGENLDEDIWSQIIGKWHNLEVLHAGDLTPAVEMNGAALATVLSIARAQYEVICVDLGSQLDLFSFSLLRESRRIFLVTTPEVVPLHMAKVRLRSLADMGLEDRVSLVLNRRAQQKMSDSDVAKAVGVPIGYSLSDDSRAVDKSILDASPVAHKCELGQDIIRLSQALAPNREAKASPRHRKFLEFFHVRSPQEADMIWRG